MAINELIKQKKGKLKSGCNYGGTLESPMQKGQNGGASGNRPGHVQASAGGKQEWKYPGPLRFLLDRDSERGIGMGTADKLTFLGGEVSESGKEKGLSIRLLTCTWDPKSIPVGKTGETRGRKKIRKGR